MNVATIPPGGIAGAHIHVDFDLMLYILEGRVRHAYGPGLVHSVENAAAVIALAGVLQRTRKKYGRRAQRYVPMEVGHAAQNVYLQAMALGLGTVVMGAFRDAEVSRLTGGPATDRRPSVESTASAKRHRSSARAPARTRRLPARP